jgi:hypothetical protein
MYGIDSRMESDVANAELFKKGKKFAIRCEMNLNVHKLS